MAGVVIMALGTISFGATGTVNTDNARIRTGASSDSAAIDVLQINEKVEVIEESGDWYKIKKGDQTGYVSKSLLDVSEATEKTANDNTITKNETSETSNNNTTEQIKLTESYVGNLLSEVTIKILPSINSANIAKVENGTQITVVEIINDWCHIETTEFSGWARVDMVQNAITEATANSEEQEEKEEQPETTENKVGYVNTETPPLKRSVNKFNANKKIIN